MCLPVVSAEIFHPKRRVLVTQRGGFEIVVIDRRGVLARPEIAAGDGERVAVPNLATDVLNDRRQQVGRQAVRFGLVRGDRVRRVSHKVAIPIIRLPAESVVRCGVSSRAGHCTAMAIES